jgi:ubiquinone/menaquinone biosynthesis C-methylase UbiE
MKSQKEIFSEKEADAWLERNRRALASFDPEKDALIRHLRPHLGAGMSIAEVGCALAGRTAAAAKITGGRGFGVDPSAQAMNEAARLHPQLSFQQATADALPWADQSIDVLIYGFCLYLCDRADLFRIAAEGDRVLKNGGLLAILDFHPPIPYRNAYSHQAGVFSYKMDNTRLWSWNPAYVEIGREIFDHHSRETPGESTFAPDERIAVSLLKKLPAHAYPLSPSYGVA